MTRDEVVELYQQMMSRAISDAMSIECHEEMASATCAVVDKITNTLGQVREAGYGKTDLVSMGEFLHDMGDLFEAFAARQKELG